MPIEPPMFESQSRGAASGRREEAAPGRHRLVDDDRILRQQCCERGVDRLGVIAPVAGRGGGPSVNRAGVERAPSSSARASSAPIRSGEHVPDGLRRRQQARLVGVGEECDRHL